MALPIAGTWLVKMPPRTVAMSVRLSLVGEHLLERSDAHARLDRADILHAKPENPGQLGEVIDVTARRLVGSKDRCAGNDAACISRNRRNRRVHYMSPTCGVHAKPCASCLP